MATNLINCTFSNNGIIAQQLESAGDSPGIDASASPFDDLTADDQFTRQTWSRLDGGGEFKLPTGVFKGTIAADPGYQISIENVTIGGVKATLAAPLYKDNSYLDDDNDDGRWSLQWINYSTNYQGDNITLDSNIKSILMRNTTGYTINDSVGFEQINANNRVEVTVILFESTIMPASDLTISIDFDATAIEYVPTEGENVEFDDNGFATITYEPNEPFTLQFLPIRYNSIEGVDIYCGVTNWGGVNDSGVGYDDSIYNSANVSIVDSAPSNPTNQILPNTNANFYKPNWSSDNDALDDSPFEFVEIAGMPQYGVADYNTNSGSYSFIGNCNKAFQVAYNRPCQSCTEWESIVTTPNTPSWMNSPTLDGEYWGNNVNANARKTYRGCMSDTKYQSGDEAIQIGTSSTYGAWASNSLWQPYTFVYDTNQTNVGLDTDKSVIAGAFQGCTSIDLQNQTDFESAGYYGNAISNTNLSGKAISWNWLAGHNRYYSNSSFPQSNYYGTYNGITQNNATCPSWSYNNQDSNFTFLNVSIRWPMTSANGNYYHMENFVTGSRNPLLLDKTGFISGKYVRELVPSTQGSQTCSGNNGANEQYSGASGNYAYPTMRSITPLNPEFEFTPPGDAIGYWNVSAPLKIYIIYNAAPDIVQL